MSGCIENACQERLLESVSEKPFFCKYMKKGGLADLMKSKGPLRSLSLSATPGVHVEDLR